MLFVPFFCISTLQSTQFIRLLYSVNNKKKRRQTLFFQIAKTKQYFGIFEFIDDHYYFGKLDRDRLSGVVVPIRK